jgi:hypothetical protein
MSYKSEPIMLDLRHYCIAESSVCSFLSAHRETVIRAIGGSHRRIDDDVRDRL